MSAIPSVFIDANVWYSAFFKSPNCLKITLAHSNELIQAYVSEQVLSEVFSNIHLKIPHILPKVQAYMAKSPPQVLKNPKVIPPTFRALAHPTDLPLVVACNQARIPYFVTGITKHFQIEAIHRLTGITILTPTQAVKEFNL